MLAGDKYIDEFARLRCAGDLLNMNVFRTAKHITKACGIFRAVAELGWDLKNPDTLAVVINEVGIPRVGAMIAFRTQWQVMSLGERIADGYYDPDGLIGNKNLHGIDRLNCYKRSIHEAPDFDFPGKVLLIYPNEADSFGPARIRIGYKNDRAGINCTNLEKGNNFIYENDSPDKSYIDVDIIGDRNWIQVYEGV